MHKFFILEVNKMETDGLIIWKKVLNYLKENENSTYINTFFSDKASYMHEFYNNTLFIKCENSFILEHIKQNIEKINSIIKNELNINNVTVQPILDDSEIKKIINPPVKNSDNILAKYTFDSFVIGNSNKFAHAVCVSVAEHPSFEVTKDAHNPLFLYGGVGLGKTHLMHAIANRLKEKNSDYKIAYVTSEKFTNELINSIKEKNNEEFRKKYRSLDVLLIDDIQFIEGKEATQEEFFHTFNELHSNNKQIIISSDRPPQELVTLEDRLRSRFESGVPIDIQAPDFETRVAILKKKCEIDQRDISDDVLILIAKNIKSNIRELEGSLNKVWSYSKMMQTPITYDMATEVLKDMLKNKESKELNIDYIKQVVAKEFNIKIDDLSSKARPKNIAYPRQIAMYLSRELTDLSLPKIGEEFGGRDHTTVMHACDKIKDDIEKKTDKIDVKIDKIIAILKD